MSNTGFRSSGRVLGASMLLLPLSQNAYADGEGGILLVAFLFTGVMALAAVLLLARVPFRRVLSALAVYCGGSVLGFLIVLLLLPSRYWDPWLSTHVTRVIGYLLAAVGMAAAFLWLWWRRRDDLRRAATIKSVSEFSLSGNAEFRVEVLEADGQEWICLASVLLKQSPFFYFWSKPVGQSGVAVEEVVAAVAFRLENVRGETDRFELKNHVNVRPKGWEPWLLEKPALLRRYLNSAR